MYEGKKISAYLLFFLAISGLFYFTAKPDKPKNSSIYDTSKLTTEEKENFSDSIKTGDAYVYYGDNEKAVEEYKQAEQLNPKDIQTLYRLATSQHNAGLYEDAEQTLKKLERYEFNKADYWAFRATNIHRKPDSLKNIKLAVKYVEKAYRLSTYKESWLFLYDRAEIYFEEYKYYRLKRTDNNKKTNDEIKANKKFLQAMQELKNLAEAKNDSFAKHEHDDLYNKYLYFPHININKEAPQLDKIEYTQTDIEQIKNHRPQDSFPTKK